MAGGPPGSNATVSYGERPKVDMGPLIELITASIAPGSWKVTNPEGADMSSAYGMGGGFGADAGDALPPSRSARSRRSSSRSA